MNFRKKIFYSVFTTPFAILTFNAYNWQTRRKSEKIQEMTDRENSLAHDPILMNEDFLSKFVMKKEWEFKPVELIGFFDDKKLLINKTKDGETGFHIVSPFYCY